MSTESNLSVASAVGTAVLDRSGLRRRAFILTCLLLLEAGLYYGASHGEKAPANSALIDLPLNSGDWRTANQGVIEPAVLDVLRADDTLSRWYQGPSGIASLFVAYFKSQRTGQSPHSPKNCLPGTGWLPVSEGYTNLQIPATGETIGINRYIVARGENKSVVLYWYQSPRRVVANEFAAKFWLVADSIRTHRSDTALVRVVIPVAQGVGQDGVDAATKSGEDFVKVIYPELKAYLPR